MCLLESINIFFCLDLLSNFFISNFKESVNTSNNQETSVVNSNVLQTLKTIQAQMGSRRFTMPSLRVTGYLSMKSLSTKMKNLQQK